MTVNGVETPTSNALYGTATGYYADGTGTVTSCGAGYYCPYGLM